MHKYNGGLSRPQEFLNHCVLHSLHLCDLFWSHTFAKNDTGILKILQLTPLSPQNVKLFGSQLFAGLHKVQLLSLLRNRNRAALGRIKCPPSPGTSC